MSVRSSIRTVYEHALGQGQGRGRAGASKHLTLARFDISTQPLSGFNSVLNILVYFLSLPFVCHLPPILTSMRVCVASLPLIFSPLALAYRTIPEYSEALTALATAFVSPNNQIQVQAINSTFFTEDVIGRGRGRGYCA